MRTSTAAATALLVLVSLFTLTATTAPSAAHHNEDSSSVNIGPNDAVDIVLNTTTSFEFYVIPDCYDPYGCWGIREVSSYTATFSDAKQGDGHCAVYRADGKRYVSCYGERTVTVKDPFNSKVCISGRYNPCAVTEYD